MKTTLVLDDGLVKRLREMAVRSGRTMSELAEAAIRKMLDERPSSQPLPDLPTFRSGGYLVDISDREALYSEMEQEG